MQVRLKFLGYSESQGLNRLIHDTSVTLKNLYQVPRIGEKIYLPKWDDGLYISSPYLVIYVAREFDNHKVNELPLFIVAVIDLTTLNLNINI